MSKEQKKTIIKNYYTNEFNFDYVKKIISMADFQNREFAFQTFDDIFVRNYSFPNLGALRKFLEDNTPTAAYIGAVFSASPSKDTPLAVLDWKRREFVIDLDLDEWDHVRTCGCKGADQMCDKCWRLVMVAVAFIDETLRHDFGFKQILWAYSGRRGVHAWVLDYEQSLLSVDQRSAIIDYLTIIVGHDKVERVLPLPMPSLFYIRVVKMIVYPWLRNATKDDFIRIGILANKANELLAIRDSIIATKKEDYSALLKRIADYATNTGKERDYYLNAILLEYAPRIDKKVSIDLNRVLRMPGSLHGKSGKRVVLFDTFEELKQFDPIVALRYFEPK